MFVTVNMPLRWRFGVRSRAYWYIYVCVCVSMLVCTCVCTGVCGVSQRLMSVADREDVRGDSLPSPRLPKLCGGLIANDTPLNFSCIPECNLAV